MKDPSSWTNLWTKLAGRRHIALLVGALVLLSVGVSLATASSSSGSNKTAVLSPALAKGIAATQQQAGNGNGQVIVAQSVKNDTSPRLGNITPKPVTPGPNHPAQPNPPIVHRHTNRTDPVVQDSPAAPKMPGTLLNFDGIAFPGVNCNCAPPDTNGEVGATQYVQIVNEGIQVWDKATGNSIFGPVGITTLWNGFGGRLRERLAAATRSSSTTSSPTAGSSASSPGTAQSDPRVRGRLDHRTTQRGRTTGTTSTSGPRSANNFYDYPKLGVWPDAYYMSMNVFNSAGHRVPRPAAVRDRSLGDAQRHPGDDHQHGHARARSDDQLMPADLDGSNQPPSGAPNPFTEIGTNPTWKLWRFHVDFGNPAELRPSPWPATLIPAPFSVDLWRWELRAAGGHGRHARHAGRPQHVPERLPPLHRRPRGARREHDGRVERRCRRPLVRDQQRHIGLPELRPAEHLPARQHVALDGKRCDGRARRHRRRLQRVVLQHQPADPLRGAAGRRSAEHAGAGRGDALRRHRQPDRHRQPLGRLLRPHGRPQRRLHVLVHERVLRDDQLVQLEDPDRELQVPELRRRAARHARRARSRTRATTTRSPEPRWTRRSAAPTTDAERQLLARTAGRHVQRHLLGVRLRHARREQRPDHRRQHDDGERGADPVAVRDAERNRDGRLAVTGGRCTPGSTSPASRVGRSSRIRSPATTASRCRRTRPTT